MAVTAFSSGWLGLLLSTSLLTKIVLGILFILFVATLAMFINRFVILREHIRHVKGALQALKNAQSFDEFLAIGMSIQGSMPGVLVKRVVVIMKDHLQNRTSDACAFTSDEYGFMQQRIERIVEELLIESEEYMPLFTFVVPVGPLLGLLGTILGLVDAFMNISKLQTVNITIIAPGIAEALITTLAGLMVAIFALFVYQFLQGKIRELAKHLNSLADTVEYFIERLLL
jgi:biopolymer transport protein ExbB/TolQ